MTGSSDSNRSESQGGFREGLSTLTYPAGFVITYEHHIDG